MAGSNGGSQTSLKRAPDQTRSCGSSEGEGKGSEAEPSAGLQEGWIGSAGGENLRVVAPPSVSVERFSSSGRGPQDGNLFKEATAAFGRARQRFLGDVHRDARLL